MRTVWNRRSLIKAGLGAAGAATISDFVHEWIDVHAAEYLETTPGIRGDTINVVHESEKSPWGGYASLWWDDQASYDEGARANAASLKATQPQQNSSALVIL